MGEIDRLTALMKRFSLSVRPAALREAALVVVAAEDGSPWKALFKTGGQGFGPGLTNVLFSVSVDWGGRSNPLLQALPPVVTFDLSADVETAALVRLMQAEVEAQRCGVTSVVDRLGEVLMVRMLRAQIEAGSTQPGLLAGLSDPRLSRAIVAIHDHPGRSWRNEDLARIAGLSLSRFAEMFLDLVGETPAAYLRRWRLLLARQDVVRGDRVDMVARRYGYGSPEGFTKAFRKQFGENPIALRTRSVA